MAKVIELYPYGLKHDRVPDDETTQELAREVVQQTGTNVPFVRADWFIATASRPPLYHTLLGIPATAAQLEKRLDVDVETNFLLNNLRRAGSKERCLGAEPAHRAARIPVRRLLAELRL